MSQNKAQVDKLLSNASSALIPEGFLAELLFPVIMSKQSTGKLGKYGTDHLRLQTTIVGGEGQYNRKRSVVRGSTNYDSEDHGLVGIVTEKDYRNVEKPFDAEKDETMSLTTSLAVGKEKDIADMLSDDSVLTNGTTLAGTAQWNDYDNSDPIKDIKAGRSSVKKGCGFEPDLMIIGWDVAEALSYHPKVLRSLGYADSRPGGLSNEELAKAFKVKRVMVGKAVYEAAKKGLTSDIKECWGNHCILAKMPAKADKYQTSLGYCFKLLGRTARRVFKSPINNPANAKQILVDDAYDFCITNVGAGYLIKNAVATS